MFEMARANGCEPTDVVLEKDDCSTLSAESERYRPGLMQVKPRSIEEVKEYIGLPREIELAQPLALHRCCNPESDLQRIQARVIQPAELAAEEEKIRHEALELTKIAAREYVMGDSRRVAAWKPTLDQYIGISDTSLNLFFFNDIIVHANATLQLSPSAHALYANRIRIHQGGKIRCNGPKTFRCASIEGNLN